MGMTPKSYASVYDMDTGSELTSGLQGSRLCDEAIRAAERIADSQRTDVHLVDDDGEWIVHPMRSDGTRESADPIQDDD